MQLQPCEKISVVHHTLYIYTERGKKIQAHIFNRYIHAHIYKYMIHVCAGVCTYKTNVGEIINFKAQKISSGKKKKKQKNSKIIFCLVD